jgi:acyl carrier protein
VTSPGTLLEAMRALVIRVVGPSRAPAESGPATPLSEGGFWLDSVELLEVVVACESEFDITFDATRDFAGDAFETLGTLAALVDRKRAAIRVGP